MNKCSTRNCKAKPKIHWTFMNGSQGDYCHKCSKAISEEVHRHAEAMSSFTPSGLPRLRE